MKGTKGYKLVKPKESSIVLNNQRTFHTENSLITLKPVTFQTIYKPQTLLSKVPSQHGRKLVSTSLTIGKIVKPTQSLQSS